MKITIATSKGPCEVVAYETCVHGLVVHRSHETRPRGWVVAHLGTGRRIPLTFPSLKAARESVRRADSRCRSEGLTVSWGYRAIDGKGSAGEDHLAWWRRFRVAAESCGASPWEPVW